MIVRAAALALSIALVPAAPATAQDADTVLLARRAAQALSQAAVALDEADSARDQVAALTVTVRAYEDGLAALREGMRRATLRERALAATFAARRDEIARLTGALTTLDRGETPLLLLHPAGPLGTARSGMLMDAVAPALRAEAARLAAGLDEARVLRALQESSTATLTEGLRGVQAARLALGQAIAARTDLPRRFSEDPEALAALLTAADTLDSFAAGLGAVPLTGRGPVAPQFRMPDGALPLPVAADLLRGFDEPDASGVARPGQLRAAAPLSLVTSPSPATVRFVGALLDYGNVIVLEPEAGYLMVLAGLGEIYVRPDEIVDGGAPLGLMGGTPAGDGAANAEDGQQGAGGGRTESLYIEIRVDGAPVDPQEWFGPEERMTE